MGIDPHSSAPIYQQVADQVRRAVAAGVYRPGEAIPSLRALAVELTVNPNTVQRAFEALEREGMIQARKGLGMFVTENGAVSARSHSEAALHATFVEGIRSAQAASIPPERIRCAFDKAWADTHAEVRDEP